MRFLCRRSPNDRGAATHLQKPLLGDVPKFPLVSMECGGRRRSCHDGRIPSTQALCEPATVGGSDVAGTEHILREVWRFVWYIGRGFRQFFLLQQVYFASCSLGLAGDGQDSWEERFR